MNTVGEGKSLLDHLNSFNQYAYDAGYTLGYSWGFAAGLIAGFIAALIIVYLMLRGRHILLRVIR